MLYMYIFALRLDDIKNKLNCLIYELKFKRIMTFK